MTTINEYMNLKTIIGTKILSLSSIQRVLLEQYKRLANDIKVFRLESFDEGKRIYLGIPSETVGIVYLVILDFYTEDRKINGNTRFKLFSNSPNTMFTFAYLYNKNDMLIDEFKKYYNPAALTEAPKHRNPSGLIGFEKSIFYAFLFIQARYRGGFPTNPFGTKPKVIDCDKIVKLIKAYKEKFGSKQKSTTFKF